MTADAAPDIPQPSSYETERKILTEHRCNVLLEGPLTATGAVVHVLQPDLRSPIGWHRPRTPLDLAGDHPRTLILTDATALDGDDQRRLLAWSQSAGLGTQVISMTPHPLFPLVAAGRFDAALYYRLNVLLLRVAAPHAPSIGM